jgi:alkylhydroperoxidase family enzyme
MAWIEMIDSDRAEGELLAVYTAMAERPIPAAYRPPHGRAPGIVRAHSLDPALMKVAFTTSGTQHAPGALGWAERELVAAVASRTAQCVY